MEAPGIVVEDVGSGAPGPALPTTSTPSLVDPVHPLRHLQNPSEPSVRSGASIRSADTASITSSLPPSECPPDKYQGADRTARYRRGVLMLRASTEGHHHPDHDPTHIYILELDLGTCLPTFALLFALSFRCLPSPRQTSHGYHP